MLLEQVLLVPTDPQVLLAQQVLLALLEHRVYQELRELLEHKDQLVLLGPQVLLV